VEEEEEEAATPSDTAQGLATAMLRLRSCCPVAPLLLLLAGVAAKGERKSSDSVVALGEIECMS
jgi:hypothetical protein